MLELMANEISPLGCEFIGKLLMPDMKCYLRVLKLDHNNFGSDGLKFIADGMATNKNIQSLSLTYCGICQKGARALFELLIYQASNLEDIDLSGNQLRNEGICEVLRGASIAKKLNKLWIADNQFVEEDFVLDALESCMKKNTTLGQYNIKFNFISDYGVMRLVDCLEFASHVYTLEIPERISRETLEAYKDKISQNKPRKGKKGKAGGKKKGKK